ncbi:D-alanyl-D-alanine carboxypeptidase [compost metagenome]
MLLGLVLAVAGSYFVFTQQVVVPSAPAPPQPITISLPNAKPITALHQDYTQPNSLWTLVNKERAIPLDYTPSPLIIPSVAARGDKSAEERSVRGDIEPSLTALFTAAKVDGHDLMIGSAYRSASLQKMYFDHYAQVAGETAANRYSAHPGESEHQTGLSVDITGTSLFCYLEACFADTPEGQWLAHNAHMYGFTLRYPMSKETITGYQFEPWHYRYVGVELATALHESNLTLEQAWPYLETALQKLKAQKAI